MGRFRFEELPEHLTEDFNEHKVLQMIDRIPTGREEVLDDEEIKFGEQLQDDLINSFCDKMQAVCPQKLEALLAIQFIMITDVEDIRRHVTGNHSAVQVLYDRTRAHYVLVHFNSRYKHVALYDSLQPYGNGVPRMITEIGTQISHLFGHLYTKYIPVMIDREFEHQSDNFSCGYRVVAALVDLARGRNPSSYSYSRSAILAFMRQIRDEPRPSWEMFESVEFGREKDYSGMHRIMSFVINSTFDDSTSIGSRSSSSYSSISCDYDGDDEKVQISFSRRDNAGLEAKKDIWNDDNIIEDSFEYIFNKITDFFAPSEDFDLGEWWMETVQIPVQNVMSKIFRMKTEEELKKF